MMRYHKRRSPTMAHSHVATEEQINLALKLPKAVKPEDDGQYRNVGSAGLT